MMLPVDDSSLAWFTSPRSWTVPRSAPSRWAGRARRRYEFGVITGLDRAPSIPEAVAFGSRGRGVLGPRSSRGRQVVGISSHLFLHILDARKRNALGALFGIAEIEFVLRQKHRIAVDVVGDAGAVGGDERLDLLAVV